jgi:hypothetical protein
MRRRKMGQMLNDYGLARLQIADTNGQITDFRFDAVERCLKSLQMLQHQIVDFVRHDLVLRGLPNLSNNLLGRVTQIIGRYNR